MKDDVTTYPWQQGPASSPRWLSCGLSDTVDNRKTPRRTGNGARSVRKAKNNRSASTSSGRCSKSRRAAAAAAAATVAVKAQYSAGDARLFNFKE